MFTVAAIEPLTWLQALLLGLLQGFTEFLPVSSTAHMAIAPQLLGMRDPGAAFSAIVQLGPIFAIIFYFRNDLLRYIKGMIRTLPPKKVPADDLDARIGWYVFWASLPGMAFGYMLEKWVDKEFRDLRLVAACLIIFAFILLLAELIGRKRIELEQMNMKQSQAIGWSQIIALIPGASRSGLTITTGLFLGLKRESAARFSFLLSIPFITMAGIYKFYKLFVEVAAENQQEALMRYIGPYIFSTVVAGAFAYVVVKWFLHYMKENNILIFIIYRIILGILIFVLLGTGRITQNNLNNDPVGEKQTSNATTQFQLSQPKHPLVLTTRAGIAHD